jgi:hypothetical protein
MNSKDYRSVVHDMRLSDGTLFAIPITLPLASTEHISEGAEIVLADDHNELLAIMRVEEIYEWDRQGEDRDPKGMYALARKRQLKGFTGVDDPYEPPQNPEITLDTVNCSAEENAERILLYLIERGFIRPAESVEDVADGVEELRVGSVS